MFIPISFFSVSVKTLDYIYLVKSLWTLATCCRAVIYFLKTLSQMIHIVLHKWTNSLWSKKLTLDQYIFPQISQIWISWICVCILTAFFYSVEYHSDFMRDFILSLISSFIKNPILYVSYMLSNVLARWRSLN